MTPLMKTYLKKSKNGEITVYLSLIFMLLISFIGAMMESASLQEAKNYRRADVNRAIESVFAEYQIELLEEYDLFGLEASYETGQYSEEQIIDRLSYYGAEGAEQEITKIQFLTDQGCQPFYDQAAAYVKEKLGITAMQDMVGTSSIWDWQSDMSKKYEQKEQEVQGDLNQLLEENEGELPTEDNPLEHIAQVKQTPILSLVLPKDMKLSEKVMDTAGLLSNRNLNRGYGDFSDVSHSDGAVSKLMMTEYLMDHFSCAADPDETGALSYELEYILAGKGSDKENLESTVKKLLAMRFVPDYTYIQSDGRMKAEAEAMALALSTVLAVPAITEAVAQAILLAWAFGEAVMDVRSLLKGNRVPLIKSKESWQLQLSSLLKLGTGEDISEGMDTSGGMTYQDYLRMLLFLENKEKSGIRSLDLIEKSLQIEKGLSFFKADQCVIRMEVHSDCSFRRGIRYDFKTYFGYN